MYHRPRSRAKRLAFWSKLEVVQNANITGDRGPMLPSLSSLCLSRVAAPTELPQLSLADRIPLFVAFGLTYHRHSASQRNGERGGYHAEVQGQKINAAIVRLTLRTSRRSKGCEDVGANALKFGRVDPVEFRLEIRRER